MDAPRIVITRRGRLQKVTGKTLGELIDIMGEGLSSWHGTSPIVALEEGRLNGAAGKSLRQTQGLVELLAEAFLSERSVH